MTMQFDVKSAYLTATGQFFTGRCRLKNIVFLPNGTAGSIVIFVMAKKTPSLAIGRGEKLPVSKGAGLTAKGRAKYNKATGSNLKAPQPEGGPRKKSFCARMSGMPGPMKDENGKPTRKAASLKRWKC